MPKLEFQPENVLFATWSLENGQSLELTQKEKKLPIGVEIVKNHCVVDLYSLWTDVSLLELFFRIVWLSFVTYICRTVCLNSWMDGVSANDVNYVIGRWVC